MHPLLRHVIEDFLDTSLPDDVPLYEMLDKISMEGYDMHKLREFVLRLETKYVQHSETWLGMCDELEEMLQEMSKGGQ